MSKPNFLFILVDDMGYGDFGVFNNGISRTPVLDSLVNQGICLTQHYSASPVCAPARAALLTGRYPHRTGVIDTLETRGLDRLALRELTIADIFKAANYTTGLIGKWHLGAIDPRYHPNARGFDEFVGFRGGWSDYYKWRLDYNGTFKKADGRYLTDVFADEAVNFIRRHREDPFFLHVTFNAPHFPLQAPEEDIKPFSDTGKYTRAVSALYGMIYRMDKGVGKIVDELKRQNIDKNTVIIITSDNGPDFGGVGDMCQKRFNADFNGQKCTVYEGGIRVPAIVCWPEGLEESRFSHEMFHFTDWFPTLLAMAGIQEPEGIKLDGNNMLNVLQGEKSSMNSRRFWQWNRYDPVPTSNAAVRDGEWKLVRPIIKETMMLSAEDIKMDTQIKYEPERFTDIYREPAPNREIPLPPPPLLFNIKDDPYERCDLASMHPEQVEKMTKELDEWFRSVERDRNAIDDI